MFQNSLMFPATRQANTTINQSSTQVSKVALHSLEVRWGRCTDKPEMKGTTKEVRALPSSGSRLPDLPHTQPKQQQAR